MSRILAACAVLATGLLVTATTSVGASYETAGRQAASGPLTPADAAPFLGDWDLAMESPNGPVAFSLAIKIEKDTVIADLGSERQPSQIITDISKRDKALSLSYTFDYEGTPVPVAITLTPAAEKLNARFDYAGGAYEMTGTGTKKEKSK